MGNYDPSTFIENVINSPSIICGAVNTSTGYKSEINPECISTGYKSEINPIKITKPKKYNSIFSRIKQLINNKKCKDMR